jgi:hypothetical protein
VEDGGNGRREGGAIVGGRWRNGGREGGGIVEEWG